MLIRERDAQTGRKVVTGARCNFCETTQISQTVISVAGRVDLCRKHAEGLPQSTDTIRTGLRDHLGDKLESQIDKDGILYGKKRRRNARA